MEGDKRELKSSNSGSFQYAKSPGSLHGSNLHWRHLPQSGTLLGHDQIDASRRVDSTLMLL